SASAALDASEARQKSACGYKGAIGGVAFITESINARPAAPLPSLTIAWALTNTGSVARVVTCAVATGAAQSVSNVNGTVHLNITLSPIDSGRCPHVACAQAEYERSQQLFFR